MNSTENNNQVEYTQEEKDLAKKFDVEPKVVRLNPEYFSEHAEESRKAEAEEPETQDQPQEEVTTPGESPKDVNQNTYTEEETSLAEKFKVEPKLVQLLKEIVEEHFAEPEQVETQDQPQEEESQPSTGISYLDDLIQRATYPEIAMAYTCLQASWINNELGDKLSATLRSSVNELLERHRKGDSTIDVECEVLPAIKWLAFLMGLRVSDDQKTELPQTTKEETIAEEPQPKPE